MNLKNKRQKNKRFGNNFFLRKNRKGNILLENIILITLNVLFVIILATFLFTKTASAAVLEEKYAKEIALIIDSAKSGMAVFLEMEDAIEIAGKENIPVGEIITLNENVVTVKLSEKGGYSYSFFNDLRVSTLHDDGNRFVFLFSEK